MAFTGFMRAIPLACSSSDEEDWFKFGLEADLEVRDPEEEVLLLPLLALPASWLALFAGSAGSIDANACISRIVCFLCW